MIAHLINQIKEINSIDPYSYIILFNSYPHKLFMIKNTYKFYLFIVNLRKIVCYQNGCQTTIMCDINNNIYGYIKIYGSSKFINDINIDFN